MDKLTKNLPILSGILIYLGYLKLHFFYGNYGISIINYLSLSEIVTSFLDDLNIIILCTILIILHTSLATSFLTSLLNIKRKNKVNKDTIIRVFSKPINISAFLLSLIITLSTALWFLNTYSIFALYLFILFLMQSIYRVYEILEKWNFGIDNWIKSVVLVSILGLLSFCLALIEINDLENSQAKIVVSTKSKEYKLINNNKLIGKTFDFYFIKVDDELLVLPKSEVISLKYY